MVEKLPFDPKLIAPCGMNCSLCIAFQREKNNCLSCNGPDKNKSKHCMVYLIKHCEELFQTESDFCYSCRKFPCRRLKQIDTRYRTKYGMSMIQNLQTIEIQGMDKFMEMEKIKWTCHKCDSLLCVHREKCQNCGNKMKYTRAICCLIEHRSGYSSSAFVQINRQYP